MQPHSWRRFALALPTRSALSCQLMPIDRRTFLLIIGTETPPPCPDQSTPHRIAHQKQETLQWPTAHCPCPPPHPPPSTWPTKPPWPAVRDPACDTSPRPGGLSSRLMKARSLQLVGTRAAASSLFRSQTWRPGCRWIFASASIQLTHYGAPLRAPSAVGNRNRKSIPQSHPQ
ncbi:hypothetical protein BO71DRAFT_79549 [Aspergillus ellipticus CBS 707.79]|uniref:Uncharacterized protein n=1 Tax=Aspergillus ellipticus CBS 707.79 TaxID=1448320 RepID=A0A319CZF2_9EURO|nr:hypothetical protein BO71DRAFT_79549 [Aspergillus ellipticus CBS 707.79]